MDLYRKEIDNYWKYFYRVISFLLSKDLLTRSSLKSISWRSALTKKKRNHCWFAHTKTEIQFFFSQSTGSTLAPARNLLFCNIMYTSLQEIAKSQTPSMITTISLDHPVDCTCVYDHRQEDLHTHVYWQTHID